MNRAKASVIVKVGFVDTKEGVLPDMAARVSFLEKEASAESMKEPPKLVVPAGAVTDRGGAKVVFVVDQGKVRMVQVALGAPVGAGFELAGPTERGARRRSRRSRRGRSSSTSHRPSSRTATGSRTRRATDGGQGRRG